jgi:hypothetical protein
MTAITLADVIASTGHDVLDHLDRQIEITPRSGLQRQGDVGLIPAAWVDDVRVAGATLVPATGVPLVSSGQGGHTHLLLADGPVTWAEITRSQEIGDVGVITVPSDATAYVAHPEHGYLALAPGAYLVRRQVEQADALRIVAD